MKMAKKRHDFEKESCSFFANTDGKNTRVALELVITRGKLSTLQRALKLLADNNQSVLAQELSDMVDKAVPQDI